MWQEMSIRTPDPLSAFRGRGLGTRLDHGLDYGLDYGLDFGLSTYFYYTWVLYIFRRRRRRQIMVILTGSWPKNFDISRMVYGITTRLASMKALAVSKQQ